MMPDDRPAQGRNDKSGTAAEGISVVIPVYQSEATLPALIDRLIPVLASQAGGFEIILVNDGSRDRSWEVIQDLAGRFPAVVGIDLGRNYGQHNALLCGIRAARHPIVVTIDDDLQHPPEEIPRLLGKLDKGFDVVYGTPRRAQHEGYRNFASAFIKWLLRQAMGVEAARHASAFRAFRTRLRDAFDSYRSLYVSIDVLLSWGTVRFAAVPVEHHPRRVGRSNYNLRKLTRHAVNLLTGFSTLPLQLASFLGFAAMAFGLLVLGFVTASYLTSGGSVPGFPFLASIIAIFSGAQLFSLGIIGTYLARMHLRLMGQPAYCIRSRTADAADLGPTAPSGEGDIP